MSKKLLNVVLIGAFVLSSCRGGDTNVQKIPEPLLENPGESNDICGFVDSLESGSFDTVGTDIQIGFTGNIFLRWTSRNQADIIEDDTVTQSAILDINEIHDLHTSVGITVSVQLGEDGIFRFKTSADSCY